MAHETPTNVITGTDGIDFIEGTSKNDVIETKGAPSNPITDVIDGKAGENWTNYIDSPSAVNVNLTTGTPQSGGDAQGDVLENIDGVFGSKFNDTLTVGPNQAAEGLGGADIINGDGGNGWTSYFNSPSGVDVDLTKTTPQSGGDAQGDVLNNIDRVFGSKFADVLTGNDKDNAFDGAGGGDNIDGKGGINTVQYANSGSVDINLSQAVQSNGDSLYNIQNLNGSDHNDKLTGNDGNNRINGLDGDDEIYGMGGNDLLLGGLGADKIDGGSGNDTVSYTDSLSLVNVNLARAGVQYGGSAKDDILSNIENITGSSYNDVLVGDANVNIIDGGVGNDKITGGTGADTFIIRKNAGYNDIITDFSTSTSGEYISLQGFSNPTNFSSLNISQSGADTIITLEDGQTVTLQNVTASSLTAASFGGTSSGSGNGIITGTDGNDILNGTSGADTINALAGNDLITGGLGADKIDGGPGNDTVSYTDSLSLVNVNLARAGVQYGGSARDDILSNIENITGSNFADILVGNNGPNMINGGAGNDQITGGVGADTLNGSSGADIFKYISTADSGIGAGKWDVINDFNKSQGDKVDFSSFAGIFTFKGTGAFTSTANEVNYAHVGGNTIISVDANSDGVADLQIKMIGLHNLTAGDFLLPSVTPSSNSATQTLRKKAISSL